MASVALDKKRLRREIERDRRAKVAARIEELHALIKQARIARDEAVRAVRADCALKRQELRESCNLRKARAKATGNAEVGTRRGALEAERRYEKQIREGDKPSRLRSTRRTTARERGQESDDEVRSNLSAEMVPVFDKVKRSIKGSPRKSRTEAFLQWAEENPGEVIEIMQHQADTDLRKLLAEEERAWRELKATGSGRRSRRRVDLSDVPF